MNKPHSNPNDAPSVQQAPASGAVAGLERTFLRLTFWQTLLSLAGVFTGAVALYAALNESKAVRQQTAASVWPYVQFMINDSAIEGGASFSLSLDNVGVGPARMRAMQVTLNGQPMRDWQSLTTALLDREVTLGEHYGKTNVSRRVLAPGETVMAFQTADDELARTLQNVVYSDTAVLSYCYCSIFDECWSTSSSIPSGEEPTASVDACPDHGSAGFVD